ncbi:MAG: hypothetical protein O7D32_02885 [bacterium]|nr:hypothetical protein [bacterium]
MKLIVTLLVVGIMFAAAGPARSQSLSAESLRSLATSYEFFVVIEPNEEKPLRFMYADKGPHIHIYTVEDGRPDLDFELTDLNTRVSAMFVRDLDKDGEESIIIATKGGRILAYGLNNYEFLFENFQDDFQRIICMVAENIDDDPQDEVIFTDGDFLYIYDSVSRAQEWKSDRNYTAGQIRLANIDDDPQLEIILNTGFVIDSHFYTEETVSATTGLFGARVEMLDLTGDGFPEILGEIEFPLRIWDLYNREELW